jgi:serine/threonine protein kinase
MEIEQKDKDLWAVLKKIGEDFELEKKLGEGAYSKVYLVHHRIFKHERALKIMYAGSILKELIRLPGKTKEKYQEISERFIIEAKIYWRIQHPNIIKIFDVSYAEDNERNIRIPYMIIQYINGVNLGDLLKKNLPLPMPTIYRVSENILSAIAAIHKEKVIHRDIKPNNIMLDHEHRTAILIDFGLAKDRVQGKNLTSLGTLLGNPQYTPPEQLVFDRPAKPNPTWDIFSFGVVLFRMLTGRYPYIHNVIMDFVKRKITLPNVRDLNPNLPAGIEHVIFKSMAWDPSHRYQSAGEFLNALREIKGKTGKNYRAGTGQEDRVRSSKSRKTFFRSTIFRVILIILLSIALSIAVILVFKIKI